MSKIRRVLALAVPILVFTALLFPDTFSAQQLGCGQQSGVAKVLNRVGLGQLFAMEPPLDTCVSDEATGVCLSAGNRCDLAPGGNGVCVQSVTSGLNTGCICVQDSHGGGAKKPPKK